MMKEFYFKITVRIMKNGRCFYVSDGYVCLKNEIFEGHITDDYIIGGFKNNILNIKTFRYNGQDVFEEEIDFFEIPETYTARSLYTGFEIQLNFEEKIIDSSKIEEIKRMIKSVKKLHNFPDISQ